MTSHNGQGIDVHHRHSRGVAGAGRSDRRERTVGGLAYEITAPDLTTKEGWVEFASRKLSSPPALPGPAARRVMTPASASVFDARRMAHHATFGPILTPQLERIHAA